jgi:hypothetical protein
MGDGIAYDEAVYYWDLYEAILTGFCVISLLGRLVRYRYISCIILHHMSYVLRPEYSHTVQYIR